MPWLATSHSPEDRDNAYILLVGQCTLQVWHSGDSPRETTERLKIPKSFATILTKEGNGC